MKPDFWLSEFTYYSKHPWIWKVSTALKYVLIVIEIFPILLAVATENLWTKYHQFQNCLSSLMIKLLTNMMFTPRLDASFDSQKTNCSLKFSRIWSKFDKNKLTYYWHIKQVEFNVRNRFICFLFIQSSYKIWWCL